MSPKPKWLERRENAVPRRFKMCMHCRHVGDPCGWTNNTGHGRMTMYRCRLHPSITLYKETYACEDYERGDNGINW